MKEFYGSDEQKVRHFVSIYTLAKTIGELEKLPEQTQEFLEISALVCNIAENENNKASIANNILKSLDMEFDITDRVCYILEHYTDFEHITGLDHQILLEAHMIVDFKEKGADRQKIIKCADKYFMTNYGKAFIKKAFNI